VRVHVTGEHGFVGGHLVRALGTHGHKVVAQADLPDIVIHAGACVGRERCTRAKRHAINTNVTDTLLRAEACASAGTSFLYVSSAEAEQPSNLYALTKRWAEDACRLVLPSEHLTIARLGAQYGPGARVGADTLSNFITAALRGEDLRVYRDTWRTWTYVEDTARALVQIAEASLRWREHGKHSLEPALVNVDSNDKRELIEVANAVVRLTGGHVGVVEVAAPAGYSELAIRTLRQPLGWEPRVTFEEGLALTYEWLREKALAA
jgi:nucleoside-diphosphate-sugar epimerase